MNIRYFAFALFALVSIFSCKKELMVLGKKHTLKYKDTATLSRGSMFVQIEDIVDSRCPENAVCFWEGEAVVTFLVSDETIPYTVEIAMSNEEPAETTFTTTTGDYKMTLEKVEPYPTSTNINLNEYSVNIILEGL